MRNLVLIFILLWVAAFVGCDTKPKHEDTLGSGSVEVSADETYRDVIEQEKRVFDSSFPNAHVTIHYKPEAECLKDYFAGKSRLILITRDLTAEEKQLAEQQKFYASSLALAKDAVAIVLNRANVDTQFSVSQIKSILTGKYEKNKYTIVFDNEASSLLRHINDSLLQGEKLQNNVYATKTHDSMMAYITTHPDAIGFASLSEVCDSNDNTNTGYFINTVHIGELYNDSLHEYVKPYLAYLALKHYPLVRKLYYINRESHAGIATGFANFLASPRGQLIFAHAHLYT
ncbi:MAG: hypothetical protein EBX41_01365 [Chitinophagia bacterium]|nr:hypothetical protein [Chitinophagia bacterium]